jgi:hypothetical protein
MDIVYIFSCLRWRVHAWFEHDIILVSTGCFVPLFTLLANEICTMDTHGIRVARNCAKPKQVVTSLRLYNPEPGA